VSLSPWLGVANAGLLLPFVLGGSQSTPAASPPWSDPPTHIEVFAPVSNAAYHSPIDVVGLSRTFEGHVGIRLRDRGGEVLAERSATGGAADGFDFFHNYVRFTVTGTVTGTVEVFETSAKDGSIITETVVPVTLLPGQRTVDLNMPVVGATLCNVIGISGYSNTFEATVGVDLRQRNGDIITQSVAMGGNLGIYADFSLAFSLPITQAEPILVSAHDTSAATGDPVDVATVPVTLYPSGSEQCP
jgi:hypothetical protein